mmetsp:Transcript_146038/g.406866  ORF Transcript_146038/g.406866 Transcript_146038/m.406866 type:complete len:561 (+) Transcript_146038:114-1796(+)
MEPRRELGNARGPDAECESQARWLLDRCPDLRDMADAGLISPTHTHNALYAHRTIQEQKDQGGRYPSNATKFAVSFGADPQVWTRLEPAWHGHVSGRHLFTILSSGLRGYRVDHATPSGEPSHNDRLLLGHTFVTPSWRLALENYGYGVTLDDGSKLRMVVQVRCPPPTRKGANTWHDPPFEDPCHDEHTIEWYVDAGRTYITGLVVKHYTSEQSLRRLTAIDQNRWRQSHLHMYGHGYMPRSPSPMPWPDRLVPRSAEPAARSRPTAAQGARGGAPCGAGGAAAMAAAGSELRASGDPRPESTVMGLTTYHTLDAEVRDPQKPSWTERRPSPTRSPMRGRRWRVVVGGDHRGIIVRAGASLDSTLFPERLQPGALVSEMELQGKRLHFKKLSGSGPDSGWVSTRLTTKGSSRPLLTIEEQLDQCCPRCNGCIRPPGHAGPCVDGLLKPFVQAPLPGRYSGTARDVNCLGDHVTFEVVLGHTGKFSLECVPQLSYFRGGQPAWRCAGDWGFDGQDVVATVTEADIKGPREEAVLLMGADGEAGTLTVYGALCLRRGPAEE